MRRWLVIPTVVFIAASGAVADITASLEVSMRQDVPGGAYRRAELTVENSGDAAIETILLKPAGAGLTVRYKLTVPPGSVGKQSIFLPAIAPLQQYSLTALDDSGEVAGVAGTSITWPAELVSTDAFIDDAFEPWADDIARWSATRRRNCLLVLAMFVTGAAATLFVRRTPLRAGAVLSATGAGTALLVFVFIPTGPESIQIHRYELLLHDGASGFESDSFAVLLSPRTTKWSRRISPPAHPVWPDHSAAASDEVLVDPEAGAVELTIRPGQVRIIRPAWRDFAEAPAERRGTVRREDDGLVVEANLNWISSRLLLIRGDSVWRIDSAAGRSKVTVRPDRAQSWSVFISGEEAKDLDRHARRLLTYWRDKHRRVGQFYLLELSGGETRTFIEVVQLREKPSDAATHEISIGL